ncbi:MAG: acyl-CoA synthetase [Salinirussus sp.]
MSTRGHRLDAYHFYENDYENYASLRADFEWQVPDQFNIATYVCDRWAENEGRIALYDAATGDRWSFADLSKRAGGFAAALKSAGVERGDRIGVNLPQRPETVVAHLACWRLGAVSVPLSTLFGPQALEARLGDCGAIAAIVDADNLPAYREARTAIDTLGTTFVDGAAELEPEEQSVDAAINGADEVIETVETDAEEDAAIIYTSGTTGPPKGVRHAHRFLLGHLPLFVTAFTNMDIREGDVCWTPAEWAWVASLFDVVFSGLFYGLPIVADDRDEFDPERAFNVIQRYDVVDYFAPPTALRMMMQVEDPGRFDVGSVRTIASGGEALTQSIVDWAAEVFEGAAVHEAYGQTEANMTAGDCTALTPFREGTIGPPAPGHELAIVDPETAELMTEAGELGEIAVRYPDNPVCFKEYWDRPDATAEKVQDGWLLTEDLGRIDEEGYLLFESRKDDVIISAGYRIGPAEIEDSIASHPAVADAGVIGIPDEQRGEVPKAFVVLGDDANPSDELRETLQNHVRDRLAQYEYPRQIEFVAELPKTATGKVRRASLRDREARDR